VRRGLSGFDVNDQEVKSFKDDRILEEEWFFGKK
jgi:hypothetical protein